MVTIIKYYPQDKPYKGEGIDMDEQAKGELNDFQVELEWFFKTDHEGMIKPGQPSQPGPETSHYLPHH